MFFITEIHDTERMFSCDNDFYECDERARVWMFIWQIYGATFATKCAETFELDLYNFITIITDENLIYIPIVERENFVENI